MGRSKFTFVRLCCKGLFGDRVTEPIFFEKTLTEANYLEFWQEELFLNLAIIFHETFGLNKTRHDAIFSCKRNADERDPWNGQPGLWTSLHWTTFYVST